MAGKYTQISHDAFSRTTLMRETVEVGEYPYSHTTCSWCGNVSHTRAGHSRLFRYYTEPDSYRVGRPHPISGLFCSISCMRSYHNG